jgi:hypothetical protein
MARASGRADRLWAARAGGFFNRQQSAHVCQPFFSVCLWGRGRRDAIREISDLRAKMHARIMHTRVRACELIKGYFSALSLRKSAPSVHGAMDQQVL